MASKNKGRYKVYPFREYTHNPKEGDVIVLSASLGIEGFEVPEDMKNLEFVVTRAKKENDQTVYVHTAQLKEDGTYDPLSSIVNFGMTKLYRMSVEQVMVVGRMKKVVNYVV